LENEGIQILRLDSRWRERTPFASMCEESANLMQVIVDRCPAHSALLRQVLSECALQARLRISGQSRYRRRRDINFPQIVQEVRQSRAIPAPERAPSSAALASEFAKPFLVQIGGPQALSLQPPTQLAKKPELVPAVLPGVALLEQLFRESIHVSAERSTSKALDRARMLEEACRHRVIYGARSRSDRATG
jgi:hypothetical protein